ncbi:MAG: MotA/TolQ/ExbB proton channel family protein [Pirellulales bacterium]
MRRSGKLSPSIMISGRMVRLMGCAATLAVLGHVWAGHVGAQPVPTADGPAAAADSPNWLAIIFFSGGPLGIGIMWLLLALSITAAYLIFDHLLSLRQKELIPEELPPRIHQLLVGGRLADAQELARQSPSLLGKLLSPAIAEASSGWPAVEKGLEDAAADQSARLMRKLEYLSVIGNIAPMLGLLGTVVGMVMAFAEVATTRGAAGAAELAEGIYTALITTIAGLIIAIPSLGAYAIFRNRIDYLIAEAAYAAVHACRSLKRTGQSPFGGTAVTATNTAGPNAPSTGPTNYLSGQG